MPNTPHEKFSKGYGKSAYEHAKPKKTGEKEIWTREDKETNDLRKKEYAERLKNFQKSKLQLQEAKQLKNISGTYKFEKGDTLYPVLKDFFGMNDHTAFFAMTRMLEHGINVDLWRPGDTVTLLADGTLKIEHEKKTIEIKDLLKPKAKAAPTESSGNAPGTPPEAPKAESRGNAPGEPPKAPKPEAKVEAPTGSPAENARAFIEEILEWYPNNVLLNNLAVRIMAEINKDPNNNQYVSDMLKIFDAEKSHIFSEKMELRNDKEYRKNASKQEIDTALKAQPVSQPMESKGTSAGRPPEAPKETESRGNAPGAPPEAPKEPEPPLVAPKPKLGEGEGVRPPDAPQPKKDKEKKTEDWRKNY